MGCFFQYNFSFMLRFVGVGARRVRSLFQAAKKKVYCYLQMVSLNCLLSWFCTIPDRSFFYVVLWNIYFFFIFFIGTLYHFHRWNWCCWINKKTMGGPHKEDVTSITCWNGWVWAEWGIFEQFGVQNVPLVLEIDSVRIV